MLHALITASTSLISNASILDPSLILARSTHAVTPLALPDEPTTLSLALVGIGLIGAYAGLRRLRRADRPVNVSWPTEPSKDAAANKSQRGAA